MRILVGARGTIAGVFVLSLLAAGCGRPRTAAAPAPEARAGDPDSVVMIGYGTQDPRDVAAAVSSLSGAELEGQHVNHVEELIQGRIPGVRVLRRADGTYSLRVRGISTIQGNAEPLIVIDGMRTTRGGNPLGVLTPRDVARIDVLKDAAATAIYGIEGMNGVILITTTRGRRQ